MTSVARAYVNHGRWIVECMCGNAVEAVHGDPQVHQIKVGDKRWRCMPPDQSFDGRGFCGSAYNVLWPNVPRIEAIMLRRPYPQNRNWMPGESFKQLLAENLENGCPIPDEELTP